jgi:uncharacterized protein YybS (DUF2232 family)
MPVLSESAPRGASPALVVARLALAVVASGALYAAGVSLAPAAVPLLLIVPLPGLMLAAQAPWACGGWLLLTEAAVGLVLGAGAAASLLMLFGLPACGMAVGFRRRWPVEVSIIVATAAWSLGLALSVLLAYGDLGAVVAATRQQLNSGLDVALSTYGSVGMSDNSLAAVQADRDALVTGLIDILPALLVLCGAFMAILNLVLLRRWTDTLEDIDLRLWRTPEALIWALIIVGFAMFLPLEGLTLVARNAFIVLLGCYFCQGLSIVSYFLERSRLPRGVRVAGYLLIAVQHIVAGIVLALGVFDLWGNFRRLTVGSADVQFPSDGE